ncbi:hypothetical protein GCM10019017_08080 [Streptomyces showdoensis]
MLVEADHGGMNAIADLVASGALRAHVDSVFPLSAAAEAHALGEDGPHHREDRPRGGRRGGVSRGRVRARTRPQPAYA